MRLYHRTDAATDILEHGFRDSTGTYLTQRTWTGVWLSAQVLDENEGARGRFVLAVDIPEDVVRPFEWVEDKKTYREFLLPATIVNRCGPPTLVEDRGE